MTEVISDEVVGSRSFSVRDMRPRLFPVRDYEIEADLSGGKGQVPSHLESDHDTSLATSTFVVFEKACFVAEHLAMYSWHHQMVYIAEHGYRAVAPDLRSYGDTTGPPINDPSKFSISHLMGDLIALLEASGGAKIFSRGFKISKNEPPHYKVALTLLEAIAPNEDKVFVVVYDWGALIAWHLCLFRPDKVEALQQKAHYDLNLQVQGDIEAEFGPIGAKSVLKKILTYRDPAPFYFPKRKALEAIPDAPIALSTWLSEEELDYYARKFEQSGFTGALNYNRALSINWELTAPWTGAQVKVPTKFVIGEFDLVYHMLGAKEYIHNGGFKKYVPLLEEVVVLEGAGQFVNQERPDEITKHIYDFIQKF
ncbi:uncharacterized protein LOC129873717 [Solanum dulcamara]|uniref:uncharacterized protein LOC129873717 n=1 Tax=Solanum dulcamara TaxID=45834 RepID=UPI0024860A64|nr:uncharacterized protein LOC129873717 [Solanum dulcamara]